MASFIFWTKLPDIESGHDYVPFRKEDMLTVSEALDIAEDRTGDYFKFSSGQWKRHRYDVKTLSQLRSR